MTAQSIERSSVRLSVVIPAFNAAPYIRDCLDSVLSQTGCPRFEVIVVDDGSTDSTTEILRLEYPSVRLIRKTNGGPGCARNTGVAEARSEVIVFIDADDVMLQGRLAHQGSFMLSHPEIALTSGNQRYQNAPGFDALAEIGIPDDGGYHVLSDALFLLLGKTNFIANPTAAVRKDAFSAVGGQPVDIRVCEDFEMNVELAANFKVAVTRTFLTYYRQGHGTNLMASPHVYEGLAVAMYRKLGKYERLLPDVVRKASEDRLATFINAYLRALWIQSGRESVLAAVHRFGSTVAPELKWKWFVISLLPSNVGLLARRALRMIKRDKRR